MSPRSFTKASVIGILGLSMALLLAVSAAANTRLTVATTSAHFKNAMEPLAEQYVQDHPEIEIEVIQKANYDEIAVMFMAGVAPDIVFLEERYFPDFVRQGWLLPLDDRLHDVDLSMYFPPTLEPFMFDGKHYGLPRRVNNVAVLYNVDLVNGAGLEAPWDGWTQEDYLAYARRLVRYDSDGGITVDGGYVDPAWARLLPWLWANGGGIFGDDDRSVTADTQVNRDTLQWLADLIHVHRVQDRTLRSFSGGRRAMWAGVGAWHIPTLRGFPEFNWDVASFPAGSAGRANIIFASTLAVASQSNHPDEAMDFVIWASGPEALRLEAADPSAIPAIRDVAVDVFYDSSQRPKNMATFVTELAYARPQPKIPGLARMATHIHSTFAGILTQSAPTSEHLINLQSVLTSILEEELSGE